MADNRPLMADSQPLIAKMNPIFADEPIAAVTLAEEMVELARPLNWHKPEWGAVLRLARSLLREGKLVRDPATRWRVRTILLPLLRVGKVYVSFTTSTHVTLSGVHRRSLSLSLIFPARGEGRQGHTEVEEGRAKCIIDLLTTTREEEGERNWKTTTQLLLYVAVPEGTRYAEALGEVAEIAQARQKEENNGYRKSNLRR